MTIFFSICSRAREPFKRNAVESPFPPCYDTDGTLEDDDSLTDGTMISTVVDTQRKSWVERICGALRRDDLEELEVNPEEHAIDDKDAVLISNAMRNCRGVSRLVFRNVDADKGLLVVTPVLGGNRSVTTIHLEDSGVDAVVSVAQEIARDSSQVRVLQMKGNSILRQGAQAIGEMLQNSQSILQFGFCHHELSLDDISLISQGLRYNQSLKSLDLMGNALNDVSLAMLAKALSDNESIEFLCLDFNDFGLVGIECLAAMLRCNSNLRELHLFGNRIDSDGAKVLAQALAYNTSLVTLVLSFNRIGDDGAIALANALTTNSTLRTLEMPSNHIGLKGLQVWAALLPQMRGLEHLTFGDVFDAAASEAIAKGLERNTRLTALYMESPWHDECCKTEDMVDFLLRFNKCGRSLLHTQDHVPPRLWGMALAKANQYPSRTGSPDVMYAILRERPDLLEAAGHGR